MELREYLKARNLTQGKFAELVEISDAYMSRILRGERGISTRVAHRIEEVTGREVSLADLLAIKKADSGRKGSDSSH